MQVGSDNRGADTSGGDCKAEVLTLRRFAEFAELDGLLASALNDTAFAMPRKPGRHATAAGAQIGGRVAWTVPAAKTTTPLLIVNDHIETSCVALLCCLELPPKTGPLRKFEVKFLLDRRRRLQHYLVALLRVPGLTANDDLRAFLSLPPGKACFTERGTS